MVRALLVSLRPRQWTKNFFIFAALLFSKNIFDGAKVGSVLGAFLIFCIMAGSTYLFNDLIDIDKDCLHPEKCRRPIASGSLPVGFARIATVLLLLLSLGGAYVLSTPFFVVAAAYLLLQVVYSLVLKHVVILDVMAITAGFALRVLAGAVVINVAISSWLIICTLLLALFLALCKRRHELTLLADSAQTHRSVLGHYSIPLLDQMISVVTSSTVIAYALYTLSDQTITKFGTPNLVYTVPFVIYGIFRYLYLVHIKNAGGSPEMLLVTDIPLLSGIALWGIAAAAIIYF